MVIHGPDYVPPPRLIKRVLRGIYGVIPEDVSRLMDSDDPDVRMLLRMVEEEAHLITRLLGTMEKWDSLKHLYQSDSRNKWLKLMRLIKDENYRDDVPDW